MSPIPSPSPSFLHPFFSFPPVPLIGSPFLFLFPVLVQSLSLGSVGVGFSSPLPFCMIPASYTFYEARFSRFFPFLWRLRRSSFHELALMIALVPFPLGLYSIDSFFSSGILSEDLLDKAVPSSLKIRDFSTFSDALSSPIASVLSTTGPSPPAELQSPFPPSCDST